MLNTLYKKFWSDVRGKTWLYRYYNFVSQVERERTEEIDRDNYNLLTKMQRIMSTQGSVDHRNTYRHHRYACSCSLALNFYIEIWAGGSTENSPVNVNKITKPTQSLFFIYFFMNLAQFE